MQPGEVLNPGQSIISPNGQYTFVYQNDGNLVVYGPRGEALWDSKTGGRPAGVCIMQDDGNLVIYGPFFVVIWGPPTVTLFPCTTLFRSDGNVVIYAPDQT